MTSAERAKPSFRRRWLAVLITGFLFLAVGATGAVFVGRELTVQSKVRVAVTNAQKVVAREQDDLGLAKSLAEDATVAATSAQSTYDATAARNASDYDAATAAGVANGSIPVPLGLGASYGFDGALYGQYLLKDNAAKAKLDQAKQTAEDTSSSLRSQQYRYDQATASVTLLQAVSRNVEAQVKYLLFRWISVTSVTLLALTVALIVSLKRRRHPFTQDGSAATRQD